MKELLYIRTTHNSPLQISAIFKEEWYTIILMCVQIILNSTECVGQKTSNALTHSPYQM